MLNLQDLVWIASGGSSVVLYSKLERWTVRLSTSRDQVGALADLLAQFAQWAGKGNGPELARRFHQDRGSFIAAVEARQREGTTAGAPS